MSVRLCGVYLEQGYSNGNLLAEFQIETLESRRRLALLTYLYKDDVVDPAFLSFRPFNVPPSI